MKLRLVFPERFDSKRIAKLRNYFNETSNLMVIGKGTYGAEQMVLHSWDLNTRISIGKFCQIADNVHCFLGGNHDVSLRTTFPFGGQGLGSGGSPLSNGDIEIGNDVWIGSHASIMSGVRIGNGAVIAAFSHVVKDVADYEIVGGNPAKHIKFRFSQRTIEELISIAWWDWNDDEIEKNMDWLLAPPE